MVGVGGPGSSTDVKTRGRGRSSGSGGGGNRSSRKVLDIGTLRTQAASRILTQIRFIRALCTDSIKKKTDFDNEESHACVISGFADLVSRNVPEDDCLNKKYGLSDHAGPVKNYYAVERRCKLVCHLQVEEVGDDAYKRLNDLLQADEFLKDNAQNVDFISVLADPTAKLSETTTKEAVEKVRDALLGQCGHIKTCCQALKRSVADGVNMVKQIKKAKEQYEKKKKDAESGATGSLQGRLNVNKVITEKDWVCLQGWKQLSISRPMLVVKDAKSDASKVHRVLFGLLSMLSLLS